MGRIGRMSENMNLKEMRDELTLLSAIVNSIIRVYAKKKSNIINSKEKQIQLEMEGSEYMRGLLDNILIRIKHLNEILIKMN